MATTFNLLGRIIHIIHHLFVHLMQTKWYPYLMTSDLLLKYI